MAWSLNCTKRFSMVVALAVLFCSADARSQELQLFDLEWNGPETSTVEECVGDDTFCFTFPITGSIGVGLDATSPYLVNIDSDILLPPQTPNSPPAISPNLWFNFDLLEGEYLTSENEGDISMVFRPEEIGGVLRAHELFVNITDNGQILELTGGIEQSAASPMEPDVRFAVNGQLTTDNSSTDDIVNGFDFLQLQRGANLPSDPASTGLTGNGVATVADFQNWQSTFGTARTSSLGASIQAVPEPSAILLASIFAAVGLAHRPRRRASR